MNDLGPDALALLESARDAHDPTPGDKARVRALLAASIAALPATAEAASSASAPSAAAGGSALAKVGLAIVAAAGLAVVGTGLYLSSSDEAPVSAAVPADEAPTVRGEATAVADAPIDVSTLAEQAQRLAEVRVALRDGAFTKVLEHVDAYEAKFPDGMLREEAVAARALALCGLGRFDEGRAARAVLTGLAPHSAHLDRIDAACK